MMHASKCRHFAKVLLVASGAALGATVGPISAMAASVSVSISGVVPNGTPVLVALCSRSLEPGSCEQGERLTANSGSLRTTFTNVAPGRYAVAVYQDLNNSGSIERTRLGLPLEPYGFSNGAGQGRRPSFDAAAFGVREGQASVSVSLRRISQRE